MTVKRKRLGLDAIVATSILDLGVLRLLALASTSILLRFLANPPPPAAGVSDACQLRWMRKNRICVDELPDPLLIPITEYANVL
jgi:hypothetical protein